MLRPRLRRNYLLWLSLLLNAILIIIVAYLYQDDICIDREFKMADFRAKYPRAVSEVTISDFVELQNLVSSISVSIGRKLQSAMRHISKAYRYSKGGIVTVELRDGLVLLNDLLNDVLNNASLPLPLPPMINPESFSARDVCPERYLRPKDHGYPFYFDNFVSENCSDVPPFASIMTVVINAVNNVHVKHLRDILAGIATSYPGITVVVGCSVGDSECGKITSGILSTSGTALYLPRNEVEGAIWRSLVKTVKTKYVFIGRNLIHFLPDGRLERLVRLLNYTGANVVGGGYRNERGLWSHGCFQASMKNYAFRLVEGYDLSYNSCLYCDYLGGPFASRTSFFQQYLNADLSEDHLFLNAFTEMKRRNPDVSLMSCPDALFFTHSLNISATARPDWLPFVRKWELNEVFLPNSQSYSFNCTEAGSKCSWLAGIAMPRCCLWELSLMMRSLMTFCEESGMLCEIEAGSAVGALKFHGNLPWERDADINWLSTGYETMLGLAPKFKKLGFSLVEKGLSPQPPVPQCMHNKADINCGYFLLWSDNWRFEIWGVTRLSNRYLTDRNISTPTKVFYDGIWINAYPNPAGYARNLYGDDVFAHVEHWRTLGYSTGWVPYKTGNFLACPRPGFHGCLDQFLPFGNLQFFDVWL